MQDAGERVGLVQVYTGDGKGKTTAAIGLAVRAAGWGQRVLIIQFLKARETGELHGLACLKPGVEIVQAGTVDFVRTAEDRTGAIGLARTGMARAREGVMSGNYDLVILDEALVAACLGLIQVPELLDLIYGKPAATELVLTGRNAPQAIKEAADLVTCMTEVKHPYQRGIEARRGVEY